MEVAGLVLMCCNLYSSSACYFLTDSISLPALDSNYPPDVSALSSSIVDPLEATDIMTLEPCSGSPPHLLADGTEPGMLQEEGVVTEDGGMRAEDGGIQVEEKEEAAGMDKEGSADMNTQMDGDLHRHAEEQTQESLGDNSGEPDLVPEQDGALDEQNQNMEMDTQDLRDTDRSGYFHNQCRIEV